MGNFAAGLPVIGGIIGANAQSSAAAQQAAAIQNATDSYLSYAKSTAAPYLSAGITGLNGMKSMLSNYYGSKIGKDNPLLTAEHAQNTSDINKSTNAALADSARTYSATGNSGRGLGSALRIGQQATEAQNKENLNYLGQQENYKNTNATNYMNGLNSLAGYGSTGLGSVMSASGNALNGQISAANSLYNGQIGSANELMSGIFGGLGYLQGSDYQKQLLAAMSAGGGKA